MISDLKNWKSHRGTGVLYCHYCGAPRLFHYCPHCGTYFEWIGGTLGSPSEIDIPTQINEKYFEYRIERYKQEGLPKKGIFTKIMQEASLVGLPNMARSILINNNIWEREWKDEQF